ncbi:MAG TPA: hypothetical protein VGM51_01690 [Armatimonadota bacterium]
MKKPLLTIRSFALAVALGAAGLALTVAAHATPVVDGTLDAEYGAPVASSPKDNLTVDAARGINDPADTLLAKPSDVTNVYVTNSGNALYIFVRLPYYSLQTMHGDWSIPIHLGGANDAIAVATTTGDPYGIPVTYNYPKNPNAVIKANVKSSAAFTDGVNGWGYLNTPNAALNGWQFPGGDYFGSDAAGKVPAGATKFHSVGSTGAEIAYANGDGTGNTGGIEMRIPFADFTVSGNLTAPAVGDTIYLQFYISIRDLNNNHPRAAIDSSPYEAGIRSQPTAGTGDPNYGLGIATQQVPYTIVNATTPFDVSKAGYTDATHVYVQFSDNVGTGGDVAANYALTDTDNGNAVVAVSAAAIDGVNARQVNLTTAALVYGHRYHLVVSNAKSLGGVVVTPTANSVDFQAPMPVNLTLVDNGGLVPPGKTPWIAFFVGAGGKQKLVPVAGKTNEWTTDVPYLVQVGTATCKFVIVNESDPNLPITDYDTLNRRDRHPVITVAGPNDFTYYIGAPVTVTFNLIDFTGKAATAIAAGKQLVLFDFDTDPATRFPLTAVSGKTNTFTTGPLSMVQNSTEYKYVIVTDSGLPTESLDYDTLNPGNRAIDTGAGNVATMIRTDTNGSPAVVDILKVAAGLAAGPTPATDPTFVAMDKDASGTITLLDALKAIKP